MKFIRFAAVTVAFIASVSAKLGFGSCPDVPAKTWDDYTHVSTGFAKDQYYYHEIIAIDNQLNWIIETLKKFGFEGFDIQRFNFACDDMSTSFAFDGIAKAVYDAAEAADASQTKADGKNFNWPDKESFEGFFRATESKLVDFKTTKNKEAEFYYSCIDGVLLIMMFLPPGLKELIYITSEIFRKLNFTLKFEVGIIVGARPAGAADVTALKTAFGSTLAKYAWSDMKVMDKAACPAL
jgi:hypothetical protein